MRNKHLRVFVLIHARNNGEVRTIKGVYFGPKEAISRLADKVQFQYLTGLKGSQEGT